MPCRTSRVARRAPLIPRLLVVFAAMLLSACSVAPRSSGGLPAASGSDARDTLYYPPPGDWAKRRAADLGMDSAKLAAAVAFHLANESQYRRDLGEQVRINTVREPYPEILGPTKERTGANGIIVRRGYIVAEWGDTRQVDMTFGVSKSYLATTAGLAIDRELIPDLHAPVRQLVDDGGFEGAHNSRITWHQLLNQTSEWEGVLWDKPDVADRRRGYDRKLNAPGTFWEYNDVRVNRTALALLRVWQRPLPQVLEEFVMDPIGASDTWEWHGYRNSVVEIGSRRMASVSGGGHWGGGVWASTRDHARFGLLHERRGRWAGRQLLSEQWIDMATTPTDLRPVYGYMWWLNTDRAQYSSAPASSFFALGAGGNVIWIDPEHDLVAVIRWTDTSKINEFMGMVVESILVQ
jgi:CubicO group peptidase (beta-lactamase class C family)